MNGGQILGAAVLVVGIVLLGFAYDASNAPVEQISDTLTGSYTDQTTMYFVLGIGAAVAGFMLILFGRRR